MIRLQSNALQTPTHLSELALYTEETRQTISYQHLAIVIMATFVSDPLRPHARSFAQRAHSLANYDAAKKQFGIAFGLDDKNGRAHTNMANLLKKHYKDYETAKAHYEKAIGLDPQNATRHFNFSLFLKHNLHDYRLAANEYEKAIQLDHGYYQAHNEYKNFLLTESPFHCVSQQHDRHSHHAHHPHQSQRQEKLEHFRRCIKYALTLLWNKKTKDAKEIMQMALKCAPDHALANLVEAPCDNDVEDAPTAGADDSNKAKIYQDLLRQKEDELFSLHTKMHTLHRRMGSIIKSLKVISTNGNGGTFSSQRLPPPSD